MKVYDTASIRNIALIGHSGSGKTQLVSAMLYAAGMVNRLGKVDDGTTVTDFDEEEIARQHTLAATPAHVEWNKVKINIIDTPGIANFLSDVRAALRVSDAAVVVIDAVSGPEVQTEKVWHEAEVIALPRVIALNRLDRERASLQRSIDSLHELFGRAIIPVQLPIGEEKGFKGVVDLISMKAFTYPADGSNKFTEGAVPEDMKQAVTSAREALIEMVAETEDALMEKFFEDGTLTEEEVARGLLAGTTAGRIFPLFCTSASLNVGLQPLLDAMLSYVPSPAGKHASGKDPRSGEELTRQCSDTEPYSAFVWKTVADPFAGRITLFKVMSGSVKSDSTVYNVTKDSQERLGHVVVLQGKSQTEVSELKAGDLGAVAKLKETHTNDTLADKSAPVAFTPLEWPEPVLSYAIEPKSRGDEEKISTAVQRLLEEDLTIRFTRDAQTKELLLAGQGQIHIEVTVAKLKRRFGVDVNLKLPRIPYRETITAGTEAHGRHKKQTGGHGQFGDCKVRMEPLPRGADFEFVDEIFGGAIPRQFIPAVEKGIQDARQRGFLAGYPVVDFRVVLFDGGFHAVDSNELSFKLAGSLAFKDGMSRARPTLLEPIMNVQVYAPSEFAGDLMGDLNSRRGRIAGMDTRGMTTVIRAQVPMAEMLTYEQQLTSATGGRGSYQMEYSHYDEVPAHLQPKIVAAAKAERGEAAAEEA
jgi:elongation factor G